MASLRVCLQPELGRTLWTMPVRPVSERTLATVLERFAAITRSVMDATAPILPDGSCALCCMQVAEPTEVDPPAPVVDHDPSECGWWIARHQVASNDVNEVLRLAHVLRYDGASRARDGRAHS